MIILQIMLKYLLYWRKCKSINLHDIYARNESKSTKLEKKSHVTEKRCCVYKYTSLESKWDIS